MGYAVEGFISKTHIETPEQRAFSNIFLKGLLLCPPFAISGTFATSSFHCLDVDLTSSYLYFVLMKVTSEMSRRRKGTFHFRKKKRVPFKLWPEEVLSVWRASLLHFLLTQGHCEKSHKAGPSNNFRTVYAAFVKDHASTFTEKNNRSFQLRNSKLYVLLKAVTVFRCRWLQCLEWVMCSFYVLTNSKT